MELNQNNFPDGNDPNNPVRIYTDGIFDLFHFGHAKVFEQCKKLFKHVYLVVGVCSDEETAKEKGRPVMTTDERAECIRHCKWVDHVVENSPWVATVDYLDSVNCHYIAHDPEPYPYNNIPDLYGPFKEAGRFLPTKRTEGVSTTDLIMRILKDYEMYIERSIKKGAKPEELNIKKSKYFVVKTNLLTKKVLRRKILDPKTHFFRMWKANLKNNQ